jgi:predicted ABC-class ATPase
MKRYTLAITEEMEKMLEKERKKRFLDSIPETVRTILSEYFSELVMYKASRNMRKFIEGYKEMETKVER